MVTGVIQLPRMNREGLWGVAWLGGRAASSYVAGKLSTVPGGEQ